MTNNVDFLPDDYLEKKTQQRTSTLCLCLFIVVGVAVAAGAGVTERRQRQLAQRSEQINSQMHMAQASLAKLKELEQREQQMLKQARTIAQLLEPVPRSLLIATITSNLPEGVSLREYRLVTKETAAAGDAGQKKRSRGAKKQNKSTTSDPAVKSEPITEIEVIGVATKDAQVASYINNLEDSALLDQVDLLFTKEYLKGDVPLRDFRLTGIVNANARASEQELQNLARSAAANDAQETDGNSMWAGVLGKIVGGTYK